MAFSFACIYVYFQDISSIFIDKMMITIILSFISTALLIFIDMIILDDVWYINNIIAIIVSASMVKFIVIRKLKSSLIPLTILWLFFILRQCGILFHLQDF
jgi:hypothetical protein